MSEKSARRLRKRVRLGSLALAMFAVGQVAPAQQQERLPDYNLYGVPGLIDMPTSDAAPDATLSSTFGAFGKQLRTTLTFQITPRLSGSFRYSALDDFSGAGAVGGRYYDRSFDLRYQLLTETDTRPSLTIGFQDVIGTGLYSSEYIVATKEIARGLRLTGGIGWGRLGSYGSFGDTGTRPNVTLGRGGIPTYDRWFRGPVAGFGGLSYAVNDRLSLKAEYSSDAYDIEAGRSGMTRDSQWNYGLDYRFRNGTQLSLYHMYGNEIGAQLTLFTNPTTSGIPGGREGAPLPVAPRAPGAAADLGWTTDTARVQQAGASLSQLAANEGIVVEGLDLQANRAVVRMRNERYGAPAQAVGRLARAMTRALPASVEQFEIIPVVRGMPMSSIILRRSDLERLEHDDSLEMLARTQMIDAFGRVPPAAPGQYPRFTWSFLPYVQVSVFDPDNPVRADAGLRARAEYRITPNFVLSGSVTKKLNGNLGDSTRVSASNLPRVRTDHARYAAEGDPAIEYLQLAHFGRPAKDLYSRVTVGYLEPMFAGASAELLWKRVNSRFALGAEINYVVRRDFDQLFGTQSMTTIEPVTNSVNGVPGTRETIPSVNGHISAYYDFGNGFHGQMDVGRYLAGDYGATLRLDREFANGWRIGAYATFTDVSSEEFGEGSFDKGIRITIPIGALTGQPSRNRNDLVIQSLTRDGGARLNVNDRLYEQVREYHRPDAAKSWGRFWR
ncbi:YjbH domain-containing protein [Thetidibacter halocola]|uniref:YjbH domain-containing protein n=1 Tax=Thetidibacter halocola TaxID=2827239 RepID=A0A8J7WBD0_9RHOB|nr:YjbH domain-containing protein [Thetidibacter halocola]MBS0123642.1 YjbH domain-containing protein [Thetidibacter halocola]